MTFIDQIDHALVIYATGALVGAIVAGYGILHILRQRRKRRRQSELDIPNFLSGRADSGHDAGSGFKGQWTEIYPGRRPPKD